VPSADGAAGIVRRDGTASEYQQQLADLKQVLDRTAKDLDQLREEHQEVSR